jgi:type IV pilus assembly protein PilY1
MNTAAHDTQHRARPHRGETMNPVRTTPIARITCQRLLIGLIACQLGLAHGAPAQLPLLKKPGGSVAPNVFYTLDDSGSMSWSYAPSADDVWYGENSGVAPVMHLGDTLTPAGTTCYVRTPDATVANYSSTARASMRLRSPDVNKIYYNPNIRYQPWAKPSEGEGNYPASSFTAAFINPNSGNGATNLIDLSVTTTAKKNWCNYNYFDSNVTDTYTPATYYKLTSAYNPVLANAANATDRYVAVRLDPAGNPPATFPKGASRTDCVALTTNNCTLAEERQNFANWFSYYRTRSLLARGASSLAFSKITDKFRVGYGQLNNGGGSTEAGVSNPTVTRGVRDFDVGSAERKAFFDWLYNVPAKNGTPLRIAVDNVGKYFKITSSTGPWGTTPGTGIGTDDSTVWRTQASCRRSYHILMTDGYWNGNNGSVSGNIDGNMGPTIANNKDGRTYQYDPSFTNGINTSKSPYADKNSDTLADIAQYYWMTDLHPNLNNNVWPAINATDKTIANVPYYNASEKIDRLDHAFWQHLTMYTVGLGVTGSITDTATVPPTVAWPAPVPDESTAVDDLFHAAVNGRGKFLKASDPEEYQLAIQTALSDISNAIPAKSGLSLSSFQASSGSLAFVPSFTNPNWTGDVQAQLLSDPSKTQWVASNSLPTAAARKIFVGNGTGLEPFNTSLSSGMRTLLNDTGNDLINFLRGDRSKEGNGYRCRGDRPGTTKCTKVKDPSGNYTNEGLIGDIVNSNPVLLSDNVDMNYQLLSSSEASTYRAFVDQKRARVNGTTNTSALVVGANDGMLHVFDAATGAEVLAYIPQAVVSNLKRLSDKNYGNTIDETQPTSHRYFVDGKLNESDVVIDGNWANVVVGSAGAGAKSVFALKFDSRNPKDFSGVSPTTTAASSLPVLWEINDIPSSTLADKAKLGHITGSMSMGRMKNGQWVVIFGNGLDSTSGGAHLWIVDIKTGAVVKTIQAGSDTSGNGLGPVTLLRDVNRNVIGAYAGDAKGSLWRFDLESASVGDWKVGLSGAPLLTMSPSRPITASPIFISHPKGGLMVMFASGRVYANGDETNGDLQSIIGVWDLTIPGKPSATSPTATMSQIVDQPVNTQPVVSGGLTTYQTSSNATSFSFTNGSGKRGWKVDMKLQAGERVIFNPSIISTLVYFNSIAPSTSQAGDPCLAVSVSSYLYTINPFTGQMPLSTTYDTNGDGVVDGKDVRVLALQGDGEDGSFQPYSPPSKVCPPGLTCTCPPGTANCNNPNAPCPSGKKQVVVRTTSTNYSTCPSVGYSMRSWQQLSNFPKNPNLVK